jgi:thiol:disulfide interchange protein DsbD
MSGKFANSIIFALACLATALTGMARANTPLPVDEVFRLTVQRGGDDGLQLAWTIQPGNYLYRDKITVTVSGRPVPIMLPPGEIKDDPNFGPSEVYHDHLDLRMDAAMVPATGALRVTYQGCAEQGICYPPVTKAVDLATLAISKVAAGLGGLSLASEAAAVNAPATAAPDAGDTPLPLPSPMDGGLVLMLVSFLGFGLLLSLTPCVFPMIPILTGMLAHSGEKLSAGRGFVLSSAYVVAMALAYAALGLAAAWSGQNLQAALQTPPALGLMAAVFVLLALSMFGLFELRLPSAWTARLSATRPGKAGSITGAAVLGFGSALIVGPCVTPPLAAALLYVAQTGDGARGAAALFALGFGMGLPLIAFGTFGSRILPKSGPWLERVNQVFGVIFLGLALAMISRAVPETYALPLWGVMALGAGVFLGAFDRLSAKSPWMTRLEKTAGLAVAIYGAALIVGFAGGATDPLRPLAFLAREAAVPTVSAPAHVVTTEAGFDAALASALQQGRPVLVSFTADWCTVCKSNERVLTGPALAAPLAGVSLIKIDVTDYSAASRALMARFTVVGPPTMFLIGTEGREITGTRTIGPITADDFAARLGRGGA